MEQLNKFYDRVKIYAERIFYVLSTLFVIIIWERLKKKNLPTTIINNDNSTNVSVDKIKKTSGVNEIITNVSKDVSEKKPEDILKKRLDEIKNQNKEKVKKETSNPKKEIRTKEKIEKATSKGKTKKVQRLKKKLKD